MEERSGLEPSLGTIMTAIQDLKTSMEPKLDTITVDMSLLQADSQNMSEKVTSAETHINLLQSTATSKKLEEQVKCLTRQHKIMAVRLEDQEGRARRNNLRVVGVAEGSEGPSVDLFCKNS
ncbi:hypothetical protein NDU88_005398 [Pleurodeles waltl]|uniref:Uncharacterized protein n=1 Tax=Pleurodeles waltl TaxID=8319 RepID=A0AAV7TWH5_PLEWA|nr:hypothetical protein NDU88_005398 [Pleurodeles waltl]